MDKQLELIIRKAAELGKRANVPTQLRPAEIGALLKEIDNLRKMLESTVEALIDTNDAMFSCDAVWMHSAFDVAKKAILEAKKVLHGHV
jgi:hypothetical protein